ncbi:MAG: hypothetical protein WBZ04_14790 [Candidatus Nanopelagicales bacterium]
MALVRRAFASTVVLGAAGALVLTGCSSNADSNPSQSATPTPTPTQTSASPSPTPTQTKTSGVSTYTVKSGSFAKIAGQGAGTWTATGGKMVITPSGSGVLAGAIEVAAKGGATKGDWILNLKTDGKGNVLSGSLTSPGVSFKVTGKGGKINYLTVQGGTTLVTESPIPVQNGTAAPTTMTLSVVGAN